MLRQWVYILFLITGIFCLYVIVLFFRGPASQPTDTVVDFSQSSTGTSQDEIEDLESLSLNSLIEESASDALDSLQLSEPEEEAQEPEEKEPITTKIQNLWSTVKDFQMKLNPGETPIPDSMSQKLSANYQITPVEVSDVFGFYIFANLPFSAYSIDTARVYAFSDPYYIIRRNMFLLDTYFTFNETNTFFGKSFFLNAIQDDSIVRFVFEYENKTFGVEVLRSEYEELKQTLTN